MPRFRKLLAAAGIALAIHFSPLHDVVYDFQRSFPEYNGNSKCATSSVMPRYRIRAKNPDMQAVGRILDNLENVPDAIQKTANAKGVVVVIVDDGEQVREYYRIYAGKDPAFSVVGAYLPLQREAVVSQRHSKDENASIALHEYGHAMDDIGLDGSAGDNYNDEFQEIFDSSVGNVTPETAPESFYIPALHSRPEFFAETFGMFYNSGRSRAELKREFPQAYDFFDKIERQIALNCIHSVPK